VKRESDLMQSHLSHTGTMGKQKAKKIIALRFLFAIMRPWLSLEDKKKSSIF
jgi:hypothetical protein